MAGHSKWNNIKQRKGAEDAKRGRVFTQYSKNIRLAVKQGGSGDMAANASLRTWVEKAKEINMPMAKIQKAIDSGLGKGSAGAVTEINYEGFGPSGVPLIIMAATDNTNRTSGEIRSILTRVGGSLGGPGSASYMFEFDREKQEFKAKMGMEVDEGVWAKLEELVDSLSEVDGVEGVYLGIKLA
ncbi:YebC/PmpR family DNA-binding transcriptional regulator [Microgenomates group bacterium]|nr:YebC/PmpR family DNA-binding transcriptional regulator [Microgenomates group bacterium]